MSFPEIVSNYWVAWSCAGFFAVVAVCSVFRAPLGLEALIIKLDSHALANQAHIIKTQGRLIETQGKLIEKLIQQLRLAGIMPWDDPDAGDTE